MSVYDARLTAAGFLGDVEAVRCGDEIVLRGLRVPTTLVSGRIIGQWSIALLGVFGMFAGVRHAGWLVPLALVFSFVSYLALWWVASRSEVRVSVGPDTNARTGWTWRWYDIFWLANALTMIALFISMNSEGRRTVSFEGPGQHAAARVRYILFATHARQAAVLTAGLLGLTSSESSV